MARAHSRKRRALFPGIPVGQIHVVKPRIVLKRIEPSADHMDAALESGAADVISGARERLQCRPRVRLRVIYFVPPDARPARAGNAEGGRQPGTRGSAGAMGVSRFSSYPALRKNWNASLKDCRKRDGSATTQESSSSHSCAPRSE